MSFERRLAELDRLGAAFGQPGCSCAGHGPGLAIVLGAEAPFTGKPCPIHGDRRLVVRIAGRAAAAPPERTHTLPPGYVMPNLPGPRM